MNYVNVECHNLAITCEDMTASLVATIAVPASIVGRLPLSRGQNTWYTFDSPQLILQVPGSFMVRA